jgi:hypothetical protein
MRSVKLGKREKSSVSTNVSKAPKKGAKVFAETWNFFFRAIIPFCDFLLTIILQVGSLGKNKA